MVTTTDCTIPSSILFSAKKRSSIRGGRAQVPSRILFFPRIFGRKRICDRRCPDVVSGCDIVVRGKKRGGCRLASVWTSGEFDFDVFLPSPLPPLRGRTSASVSSTQPRWGRQRCPHRTCPHVFRVHRVYTSGSFPWRLQVHPLSVCTEPVARSRLAVCGRAHSR